MEPNNIQLQSNMMITNSFFCFKCGAILTTEENKKQHEIFELNKKNIEVEDMD
jgi:hypothetical protein